MIIKRLPVLVIALVMLILSIGLAESSEWTCPNCAMTGNTGNFCSNCGTARPSEEWVCLNCGQNRNKGKFCSNCGAARTDSQAVISATQESTADVNENLEQIAGESERVKVIVDHVDASSYISNKQDPSRWKPENAVDGNETTCW